MSNPGQPVPVSIATDNRPAEVVVISHSPLFYWWPVWAVGFIMAGLSYLEGYQMAFVPTGTVAERGVQIAGHEGTRDVLIAPEGVPLPTVSTTGQLEQPRMRMAVSNNPGIIWALTLCIVIVVTHIKLRGMWSLIVVVCIVATSIVLAVLRLWDPVLRTIQIIDIHMNGLGYLSISLFLFAIWLFTFLVVDRLTYMIFTRGRLRVRTAIGEGEKIFDMRGMMFERHRDDLFRHWVLGIGAADLTVYTAGANARQIEMPNVFGIGRKLTLINTMLQELEVIKGR